MSRNENLSKARVLKLNNQKLYKLLNQLFALVSFCSKIFYTLKLLTLIKTLKLITPTCFGPTGPSSGSTSILAKVTTDR